MKTWKVTTPALEKDYVNWRGNNEGPYFLCRDVADEFWDIPQGVGKIWVVVTSIEKEESVPITFQKHHSNIDLHAVEWELGHKQKARRYLLMGAQRWLLDNLPWSKNGILKVYVTVEYKE